MTKKRVFIGLILLALALLESSFIGINLILLVVLAYLLLGDLEMASYSAFCGGLILDFLSTGVFGVFTLELSLVCFLYILLQKFTGKNPVFILIKVITFTFFYQFLTLLPQISFEKAISIKVFYDLIVLLPILFFIRWANEFFTQGSIRRN